MSEFISGPGEVWDALGGGLIPKDVIKSLDYLLHPVRVQYEFRKSLCTRLNRRHDKKSSRLPWVEALVNLWPNRVDVGVRGPIFRVIPEVRLVLPRANDDRGGDGRSIDLIPADMVENSLVEDGVVETVVCAVALRGPVGIRLPVVGLVRFELVMLRL